METESTTMGLKDTLNADMKAAMLSKDNRKRDVLRVLKAEISREEAGLKIFSEQEVITLIRKMIKNLETVVSDDSKEEIKILEEYIPQLMSDDQVKVALADIIATLGATSAKDMGSVMKAFKAQHDGKADNKLVSTLVKSMLE